MMNRKELEPTIRVLQSIASGKTTVAVTCTKELRQSCRAALAVLVGTQPVGDETYILEFDGASKGNPGPAGLGVVIYDASGTIVQELGRVLPVCTNNAAEYQALLAGLELARQLGLKRLSIRTDSELVAKQLRGEYKIKKPELAELAVKVRTLLAGLESFTINHIPREQNKLADKLASAAIKAKAHKEQ